VLRLARDALTDPEVCGGRKWSRVGSTTYWCTVTGCSLDDHAGASVVLATVRWVVAGLRCEILGDFFAFYFHM
jgi:hypothetical protein